MSRLKETLSQRAVHRCCDEICRSILYFRCLRELYREGPLICGVDFTWLVVLSFKESMLAHAMKVLKRGKDKGFWYLYDEHKEICEQFCVANNYDVAVDVAPMTEKLFMIRNATAFHLDKDGVMNPRAIYEKADIEWMAFERALLVSHGILSFLHKELRGVEYPVPEFDLSSVTKVAKYVEGLAL